MSATITAVIPTPPPVPSTAPVTVTVQPAPPPSNATATTTPPTPPPPPAPSTLILATAEAKPSASTVTVQSPDLGSVILKAPPNQPLPPIPSGSQLLLQVLPSPSGQPPQMQILAINGKPLPGINLSNMTLPVGTLSAGVTTPPNLGLNTPPPPVITPVTPAAPLLGGVIATIVRPAEQPPTSGTNSPVPSVSTPTATPSAPTPQPSLISGQLPSQPLPVGTQVTVRLVTIGSPTEIPTITTQPTTAVPSTPAAQATPTPASPVTPPPAAPSIATTPATPPTATPAAPITPTVSAPIAAAAPTPAPAVTAPANPIPTTGNPTPAPASPTVAPPVVSTAPPTATPVAPTSTATPPTVTAPVTAMAAATTAATATGTPIAPPPPITTQPLPPTTAPPPVAATPVSPPPAPTMFTAQVLSQNPGGQTVVQSPIGALSLPLPSGLPSGALVTLEMSGAPQPPATPPPFSGESGRWAALNQFVSTLAKDPMQAPLLRMMPQAGPQLAATLAVMATAVSTGNLRPVFGDTLLRSMEKGERGEAGRQVLAEFQDAADEAAQPSREWRALTLPFVNGGVVEPIRLFLRRPPLDEGDIPDAQKAREGDRFLIDITFSRLGRMQLDGLVKRNDHIFDLILRTHHPLGLDLRKDIIALFQLSVETIGVKGSVIFQSGGRWVEVAQQLRSTRLST